LCEGRGVVMRCKTLFCQIWLVTYNQGLLCIWADIADVDCFRMEGEPHGKESI